MTEQESAVTAGAAAYTPLLLKLYDAAVVYASNTLLWRCSRHVLLANYQADLGKRHLVSALALAGTSTTPTQPWTHSPCSISIRTASMPRRRLWPGMRLRGCRATSWSRYPAP